MKSSTKLFCLLMLFLLAGFPPSVLGQPEAVVKEPPVWRERSFSEEKLAALQQDSRLDYPQVKLEDSWWTRFKRWFSGKLAEFFSGASRNGLLEIILYLLCGAAGVFIVFRFLDIDLGSVFKRSPPGVGAGFHQGISENIHTLDFEKEIAAAVQQQDFRKAVRLVYLASLKRLTDAGFVHWEPGKTNSQYQRELSVPQFSAHFASLGYYFEYAWYGDFPVNEQLYRQVEQTYRQFSQQLEVKA